MMRVGVIGNSGRMEDACSPSERLYIAERCKNDFLVSID